MIDKARSALTVLILTLGLALQAPAWASQDAFSARSLADGVLLVTGPAGNTLVGVEDDGLVLVDGVPEARADEYLDFVRQETGVEAIKALLLTHWHPEVAGLNDILGQQGVPIIAHRYTRQWLGTTIRQRGATILHEPLPEHALPDTTFLEQHSLPFRAGEIAIGHLPQAHTDGDFYVHFRDQDILYTGDVMRSDAWAEVHHHTNGYMGGLMDGLDQLAGLIDEDTVVVPGSGPLLDKAGFDEQHALYQQVMEEMVTLLREAKSAEEVVALDPASALQPEWDNAAAFLDQGFRSFYIHLRDGRHVGTMP